MLVIWLCDSCTQVRIALYVSERHMIRECDTWLVWHIIMLVVEAEVNSIVSHHRKAAGPSSRAVSGSLAGNVCSNLSGECMSVSCEWCVFSGRGLCDRPIPCPHYRVCMCVWEWSKATTSLHLQWVRRQRSRRRRKEISNAM